MNQKVTEHLEQISSAYTTTNDKQRAISFRKATEAIAALEQDVSTIDFKKTKIKYVGKAAIEVIKQFLSTGTSTRYDDLIKVAPPQTILEFTKLNGVGPVGAKNIWEQYKVASLKELVEKINSGEIKDPDLKDKIEVAARLSKRIPFAEAQAIVEPIIEELLSFTEVQEVEAVGSYRRLKTTIGDLDLLVLSNNREETKKKFLQMGTSISTAADGTEKVRIELHNRQIDLLFTTKEEWAYKLLYFTGSASFNKAMRSYASKKGLKLSEKSLVDRDNNKSVVAAQDEKAIFNHLGLPYVVPELREEEAAQLFYGLVK